MFLFLLLGAISAAPAQDGFRVWSSYYFDPAAFAQPIVAMSASYTGATAVIRADGRLFVHGSEIGFHGLCRPPEPPAGLRYESVSLGGYHGLALLSDGSAVGWGSGGYTSPPAPPVLPPGMRYLQVSAGQYHGMALRSDGVVLSWVQAPFLLGMATVPQIPPGRTVVQIHAGGTWALMLLSDGTLSMWENFGPIQAPTLPAGLTYTRIFGGWHHFLALRSDGELVAWGDNSYGQCNIPPTPPGVRYVQAAAGGLHSQALRSDGVVVAWGSNDYGQSNLPAIPAGRSVVSLSSGGQVNLILLDDGSLLGAGTQYALPLPSVQPGERWVDVGLEAGVSCAVTSGGQILGVGKASGAPPIPAGLRYEKVRCGVGHRVALRSDGTLVAWGENYAGQANVPALPAGVRYVDFAVGEQHTIAIRSDGQAVAWGVPNGGVLNIPPLAPGVRYVAADATRLCSVLLRSDGTIVVLGGTSTGVQNVPTPPAGVGYVAVGAARTFLAAVRSDGQAVVWSNPFPVPPLPPGVVYVADVAGGEFHVVLRRSDGKVVHIGGTNYRENWIPECLPGESYVQVDALSVYSAARYGPTCTYVTFADGCAGSRPAARLVPRDTPRIGKTLEVTLFDLPVDAAIMFCGWQRLPSPMALDVWGMPGCTLHVDPQFSAVLVGGDGQAKHRLPIPNLPGLVGLRVYSQAGVLDPGANSLGVVLSAASEAVIGHQ